MSRTYSDPSYGAKKQLKFAKWSCGTRAAGGAIESISMLSPFEITDLSMKSVAAGSGAACSFSVVAGTTVIGTLSFATNATASTVVNGNATSYKAGADTLITLQSVVGTADPAQTFEMTVEYIETFVQSDT